MAAGVFTSPTYATGAFKAFRLSEASSAGSPSGNRRPPVCTVRIANVSQSIWGPTATALTGVRAAAERFHQLTERLSRQKVGTA